MGGGRAPHLLFVFLALFLAVGPAGGATFSVESGPGAGAGTLRPAVSPARRAFEERLSGVWLEVRGEVERLLRDDRTGRRHQRFVIRLPEDLTLLVSHNIDLAPRVPVTVGEAVEVRGRYEWNAEGGLLHWTHRDPAGRLLGGWIRHMGRLYR